MKRIVNTITVGKLRRVLPTFVFLIVVNLSLGAVKHILDFAFPKSVIETGDSLLKEALSAGYQELAFREAMNICVAENLLEKESTLQKQLFLLDSMSREFRYPFRELTFLLEADILYQEYLSKSNIYDSRFLPVTSNYPSDPLEWTGELYKKRILEMIDSATNNFNGQEVLSLDRISSLLSNYQEAERIGMNVEQFVSFKSAKILGSLGNSGFSGLIPFYKDEVELSIDGQCSAKAKSLLKDIITQSSSNSVIKSLAIAEFSELLPEEDKKKYLSDEIKNLKGAEGEGLLLYKFNQFSTENNSEYYRDICRWLQSYPNGFCSKPLKFLKDQMTEETIECSFPKVALPGKKIEGKVTVSNLTKGYLLVYKLTSRQANSYDELIMKNFNQTGIPEAIVQLEGTKDKPSTVSNNVEIPPLMPGLYVIIPSLTEKLPSNWKKSNVNTYYSTIRVTDISLLTSFNSNEKNSGKLYVVSAVDQKPIAGATVELYENDGKAGRKLITNKEGFVEVTRGYYRIVASHGKNIIRSEAGFSYYSENEVETKHSSILTDLSVYHPGDTVRFAVVGWKQNKSTSTLLRETSMKLQLRDVNNVTVDTLSLNLNNEGRAWGSFIIPGNSKLGSFSITSSFAESFTSIAGVASILVEEYKLPPFYVSLEQTESSDAEIKFKGSASTFSGMPVEGKSVITVNFRPFPWFSFGSPATYKTETECDSKGDFIVSLPLDNLKGTRFEKGRYSVSAMVTSPNGETVTSPLINFYLGESCEIRPKIPEKIKIEKDFISLDVPVYDMAGLPVRTKVDYKLINISDSTYTLKGSFMSPNLVLNSEAVRSGKYRLEFTATSDERPAITETVFWRETDSRCPYPNPLWIPETEYYYEENQKSVEVSLGSYWPDWLLYVISYNFNGAEKEINREWLKTDGLLSKIQIEIPEGNPTMFVNISGLHDFESKTGIIKIAPRKTLAKMNVEKVSFRENITAGSEEDWSFRFNIDGEKAPFVNVLAVMTDKALNSINDFKWNLGVWTPDIYSKVRLNSRHFGWSNSYKRFSPSPVWANYVSPLPDWNTYDYPLVSSSWRQGPVLYRSFATNSAMMKSAPLNDAAAMKEDVEEEMALDTAAVTGGMDSGSDNGETLRAVEMPLVFFYPDLKTDENGEVNIKFTTPDFNTTWQFQILGYDEEMKNTSLILDATSSKPVMVRSNLPQFLRTGDYAEISAVVYNNTDSTMNIGGKMEVFNPATKEIMERIDMREEAVAPSGSRIMNIRVRVPGNIFELGVRSYAISDGFSDGEQGFVPVLPSSSPVTEAVSFYAGSDQTTIELKVPKLHKEAEVTLKYLDNPVWEVLLSMPEINDRPVTSSTDLAQRIYSTGVCFGLVNSNPSIAEHIERIGGQKPGLLKYLDKEEVERELKDRISQLKDLQGSDGGFSWCPGMKSSPYITARIIGILANLNQREVMPEGLKGILAGAVKYCDNNILKQKDRGYRINPLDYLDYFYSRQQLGIKSGSAFKKIEEGCIDSVAKNWRKLSLENRAKGGMWLRRTGNVKEARTIAESLSQFVNSSITLQEAALMLLLFEKTGTQGTSVDTVKEILYLKKETEDWTTRESSVSVTEALLSGASDNDFERAEPKILIDGKPLQLPECENPGSNFVIDLSVEQVSGKKLIISREGGIPAWGGVISRYIAPVREIKSASVSTLSIGKSLYPVNGKGKTTELKTLKRGEEVKVVLTLSCEKEMDYVVIKDSRAACLRPDENISGMVFKDGLAMYQEIGTEATTFYIERLPAGKYIIEYDCHVEREGEYALGIAEVKSLYSPIQVAHSEGKLLKIE